MLECKWGLIRKRDLDDFMNVLRWSTDFGVDTTEGRQLKQGVTAVLAGTAFNPDEGVVIGSESMSLGTYANRLNVKLLKAVDFNSKLREHGCEITIQAMCKAAKDEREVRSTLDAIWNNPLKANEVLTSVRNRNMALYQLEKTLEESEVPAVTVAGPVARWSLGRDIKC